MTILACALVAGWAVSIAALAQLCRSERRETARERSLLINQLCHLSGHPWSPPPTVTNGKPVERVPLAYTVHPEGFDWPEEAP